MQDGDVFLFADHVREEFGLDVSEHPRIGAEERPLVARRDERVDEDIGGSLFVELAGEEHGFLAESRADDHDVAGVFQRLAVSRAAGIEVELVVIEGFRFGANLRKVVERLMDALFDLFPIFTLLMAWKDDRKGVLQFDADGRNEQVGAVEYLFEHLFHLLPAFFRNVAPVVQHPIDRTDRYAGHCGDILDLIIFAVHKAKVRKYFRLVMDSAQILSSEAAPSSRKSAASSWVRRIEAGHFSEMGP